MSAVVVRSSQAPEVESLARQARLHPDLVRRLVSLGFLDPYPPDAGDLLTRAVRLRRDLGLSFSGALLACELLARIDDLEARLRRYER